MALAQKELDRVTALTKTQVASRNSLDKAEQQYLGAKLQLQAITNRLSLTDSIMEQKQAALAMARVEFQRADLSWMKTLIVSDFDGFILDKAAQEGEYVNPGQVIGTLYEKNSLDVDVSIPLEKMKWVEPFFRNGQTPMARVMLANFDGAPAHVWDARVARVKAKIDEKTRTLPMTIEILHPDSTGQTIWDLKPGTFVKCSILGETIDNLFVLPRYLLKGENRVFTVTDRHLEIKEVILFRKFEEEIFISQGLQPGDKIISSPLPGAIDGMELNIKENGK
jgi:multidrug efflux pump subunit AcrA (membrane-fusion protein)